MKSLYVLLILSCFSLLFMSGCVEQTTTKTVDGSFGEIVVKGLTSDIEIVDYTIISRVYNETLELSESKENFVFNQDTIYYQIDGTAKNIGENSFDLINISVHFFRDENKGIFFIGDKFHLKYNVDPGEEWTFSMELNKNDRIFGPIESIEFKILSIDS